MTKLKAILISVLALSPLAHVVSAQEKGFDAKYINEGSNAWPFERYGKILNIDSEATSFDFLKDTVYDLKDRKTVVGRAWNKVHWAKDTVFIRTEPVVNFSGIKTPMVAKFKAANPNEAKNLSEGKDFTANASTVYFDIKEAKGLKLGEGEIAGLFTPDSPLSGVLDIGNKSIKVSMLRQNPIIFTHKMVTVNQLKDGYWSAKISGAENEGKFIASMIDMTAVPDPKAGDDAALPRLLVIGDSISMNFEPGAKESLKGMVNYHRNEGNCFSSYYGIQYVDFWLGDYTKKGQQWDIIHFNHGMHDLKQSGPGAPFATPIESYKANLRAQIEILKKTRAKLIWCSTTPVPQSSGGDYGRQKGAEVVFNQAAMEVLKEYPEIQVNDLCKAVNESKVFDQWRKGLDVHYYTKEETDFLGQVVAASIKKVLEKSK